jgi:hypothetical protein
MSWDNVVDQALNNELRRRLNEIAFFERGHRFLQIREGKIIDTTADVLKRLKREAAALTARLHDRKTREE